MAGAEGPGLLAAASSLFHRGVSVLCICTKGSRILSQEEPAQLCEKHGLEVPVPMHPTKGTEDPEVRELPDPPAPVWKILNQVLNLLGSLCLSVSLGIPTPS